MISTTRFLCDGGEVEARQVRFVSCSFYIKDHNKLIKCFKELTTSRDFYRAIIDGREEVFLRLIVVLRNFKATICRVEKWPLDITQ